MNKSVKAIAVAATVAGIVAGGAIATAPAASASTASFHTTMVEMKPEWRAVSKSTSATLANGVCTVVKTYGKNGITAAIQTMKDSGLDTRTASMVVIVAVGEVCPSAQRHVNAYMK